MGIYTFDHAHAVPARDLGDLLGGKGAGLAEMTRGLGMSVPPGFTLSLEVCREFRATGWPPTLDDALDRHMADLGTRMGRGFGDEADPLLVAVRSGAPVSMPGMLDTVLNLGLNDETVLGLAASSGDEYFAWDSYRRFLIMFATTVMDVPAEVVETGPGINDLVHLRGVVSQLKEAISATTGRPVPSDPMQQLREATEAVFRSWDCARARAYRAKEGIDEQIGTAVNVQAMVFGNRGADSGTGVVFTRNPATGEPGPYGDYLPRAQGEDVVAGTATTRPITYLGEHHPAAYAELLDTLRRLEIHYRDICDVEFTVENGHLWMLQTRVGKRGAVASVRIAVDLVNDPDVQLNRSEALERVPPALRERARSEVLDRISGGADSLTTGLAASPGRVSGKVVLTSDDAADAGDRGEDVILVRAETSPEDVAGMAAAVGILTTRGGLVSHAAVVARGWGIPAVVGAHELTLVDGSILDSHGTRIASGSVITIDGGTGQVWVGEVTGTAADPERAIAEQLPELALLDEWAAATERTDHDTDVRVPSAHARA